MDDHRGLCRPRTEVAQSRGTYTAQICHHIYRKGSKCKGFTKSLNFWRPMKKITVHGYRHCIIGVACSSPWFQAQGLVQLTLSSPPDPEPHTQLGKVSVTRAASLCPEITPSPPHVHPAQTRDLPGPGSVSHQDTSQGFIHDGDAGRRLCAYTHRVYVHPSIHVHIQAQLFYVDMHLTCTSLQSFTSQT